MRARPQAVAERERDVVDAADVQDLVERSRNSGFSRLWCDHPVRQQRAAARDDAGHAVPAQRQVLEPHSRVDRHVVDALLGLVLDRPRAAGLRSSSSGRLHALDGLIDRHGPDRHGRGARGSPRASRRSAGRSRGPSRCPRPSARRARSLSTSSSSDERRRRAADVRVDLDACRVPDRHRVERADGGRWRGRSCDRGRPRRGRPRPRAPRARRRALISGETSGGRRASGSGTRAGRELRATPRRGLKGRPAPAPPARRGAGSAGPAPERPASRSPPA